MFSIKNLLTKILNKIEPVGKNVGATSGTIIPEISIAPNGWRDIGTITIPAGTHIIFYSVRFPKNGKGNRLIRFGIGDPVSSAMYWVDICKAISDDYTQCSVTSKTDRLNIASGYTFGVYVRETDPIGPYMRWVKGEIMYQLRATPTELVYERYDGSSWITVWRK